MVIDTRRHVSRDLGFDTRLEMAIFRGQDDGCRQDKPGDASDIRRVKYSFNSALWECEGTSSPIGSPWHMLWLAAPGSLALCLGFTLQWVAYSRLTPQTSPRSSAAEYGPLFAAKVPPPPAPPPHPHPHPSSSAPRGRKRRRIKRCWNASTPFVPPGTISIPTVAIFSGRLCNRSARPLVGKSVNFQEIWFSRSRVPHSFPGVFISAEHPVYHRHSLLRPISCKSHGQ